MKILKNTIWLAGGELVARLLRAGLVVYAARILGASQWGSLAYLLSLTALFSVAADMGVSAVLTREIAKQPNSQNSYLSTSFVIKLILMTGAAIGLIISTPYFTKIKISSLLVILGGVLVIFNDLRTLAHSLARAIEKMHLEAIEKVIVQSLILILGILILIDNATVENLVLVYIIGSALGSIFIFWKLFPWLKNNFSAFNKKLVKPIISSALPFALMGMMGSIMLNTDNIMLGWFRTAADIGYYSAAQKIIQLLYIIPTWIAIATFPSLARLTNNKAKFAKLLNRSFKIVLMIALPIVIGGIITGAQIIQLLFGTEYLPATIVFQILLVTILINFPATLIGNSLFAYDQKRAFVNISVLGAGSNVIFNLLLIPFWGIQGAAISTIITQLISNVYAWQKLKQINPISINKDAGKTIIASVLMGAIVWIINANHMPILLTISVGGAVYLAILILTKEKEIMALGNIFLTKKEKAERYKNLF